MTFTRTLFRAFWRAVAMFFGALFAIFVLAGLLGYDVLDMQVEQPETDPRISQIQSMLDWYGCWTGEAPKGVEPTHAVVSYKGGDPNLVGADLGYDIWLHPERNPGMTLHGFCGDAS